MSKEAPLQVIMKRIGFLYEKIISIENLQLADKKAQKGKSRQYGVIRHNENRESNILMLHEQLKNKSYKTSEYYNFIIKEPKERIISRLEYYPNRIVHHALINYLEPIFTRSFIAQTYSCIKGRGIHKALRDLTTVVRGGGNKYCLKLDVRKFYPSVNLEILKKKLRTKFKDRDLLWLLDEIIDSHKAGLPLGNLLSQWMANFYLSSFDHWLKEIKRVLYYRYCDDICVIHSDKKFLHNLRREIQEYLKNFLCLELSNYQVFPIVSRGIDFVGYVSYPTHIRLRKSIKQNFKKMLKRGKNYKSIASYYGWLKHGNCRNLENKYFIK